LNIENYSNIDKSFEKVKYSIKTQLRKVVTEKYRNKFKEKLSSYSDESNLFSYIKLKSSIGLEKYLSELTSFKNRVIFLLVEIIQYMMLYVYNVCMLNCSCFYLTLKGVICNKVYINYI
jgi:hypothetical protein